MLERHGAENSEVYKLFYETKPHLEDSTDSGAVVVPLNINGIFPHLTATADSAPKRSECGTGALMPWADHLYMVSYLSVPGAGNGTGLYAIDANLQVC